MHDRPKMPPPPDGCVYGPWWDESSKLWVYFNDELEPAYWGGESWRFDQVLESPLCNELLRLATELAQKEARIKELEGMVSQAINGLSRMTGGGICLQDGGGFFVPMYDPDGEYLGEQQLDPQHVAIMGFSMASDLIALLTGGHDA